jgi:hypothetical protein
VLLADSTLTSDEQLISILSELVADPKTTDVLRVKIIDRLLEETDGVSFFATMLQNDISKGACPCCGHENFWLIPEDELNKLGVVTHRMDPRVPEVSSEATCSKYQEACIKRKVSV